MSEVETGGDADVKSKNWDGSNKNEDEGYGQSNLEVLHEDLLRIIFKMMKTRDLKAVRLTSSTMRRRVLECEDKLFKYWKLNVDMGSDLKELRRFSGEVTIIKDLTVSLKDVNFHSDKVEIEDFVSSMRSILERHQEVESLRFIFLRKDRQFISETIRRFGNIIRNMEFHHCLPPNLAKESLPLLERLGFVKCDLADQELEAILQQFGDNLVQLKLDCKSLTGVGVAEVWKPLPRLLKLEIIGLRLTNHELSKMLSLMQNLTTLVLELTITGEGVSSICKCLPNLISIDVSVCFFLTNIGLSELLSIMPNIQSLKLPQISNLTGEGISAFCKSLPNLMSIDLSVCYFLSDIGTSEILSIMPNIRSLKLPQITNLTVAGISTFCKSLPKLTTIDISSCTTLTVIGLNEIRLIMPNIKSLRMPNR